MNLINLGLLGVEHGDKSAFFLNLSGNFREEALRDLPVLGVEQFEKSSSLIVRLIHIPEIYIQSAPNNSNETCTFMCLGRAGRFGQC